MSNRFITKLIERKVIDIKEFIINHYVELGLNETEAMVLIHLYNFILSGSEFLSINQLTKKTSLSFVDCSNLCLQLAKKNFIAFQINLDENGKTKETFTLEPLFDKIYHLIQAESEEMDEAVQHNQIGELVQLIEVEFGRPISSFEIQLITSWITEYQFDFEVIKQAIKEALLANAYNLKYVDRILLNWSKLNIRTIEDAQEYTKTYKRVGIRQKNEIEEEEYVSWMTQKTH